jgi:hypothetical protein
MTSKTDTSRRDVLKKLGGAAGAVVASPLISLVPGSAFAAGSQFPSSRTVSRGPNQAKMIVVEPKEIDASLGNPGRGFTTTGNTYNEDLGNERYPISGVIQKRWYWDKLEPEEGKIDFSMIDHVLAKAAKNRQQLNFRVMCQNVKMRIPKWAMEQGIKQPYYDNPVFLELQAKLIKALADRYDHNPNLAYVDIGTVGEWGEWHTTTNNIASQKTNIEMPSHENCVKIIDMYLQNFRKKPLLMLIGGAKKNVLHYAVKNGAGWRADCWGDMDKEKWNLMKGGYPKMLSSGHAYDAWKRGPVALETCWTMSHWYKRGWDIDYILSWALERHATEVNNGDEAIPEKWWPKVQEFEKKLGYRFVLKQLRYPAAVKTGDTMHYAMQWENKGVAPIYQRCPLVFRFRSANDAKRAWTVKTDEDIAKWMPGLSTSQGKITIPHDIPRGKYEVDIGIVKPGTKKAWIKLAIAGKTSDNWYRLGHIQLS